MSIILIKIVQTRQITIACPSQWDAWDSEGNYWYLRFRFGIGTAEKQSGPSLKSWQFKEPEISFNTGHPLDGFISLEEFCWRAGMQLEAGT